MRVPNFVLLFDALSIVIFLFLFLPIYREPYFEIVDFGGDIEIVLSKNNTHYKILETDGNVRSLKSSAIFSKPGLGLECTGYCDKILKEEKANATVFVTGDAFSKLSTYLLRRCLGFGGDSCENHKVIIGKNTIDIIDN